jgi:hypothetical protein
MAPAQILWPVIALAAWTFIVLLLVPIARFRSAARGEVKAKDFRYGESAGVPGPVSLPNRNLMNLLELPLLFYVLSLGLYITLSVDQLALMGAWAYVALRAAHSLIHLTYNNVFHRLAVYAASSLVLFALWVRWAIALASR